MMNEGESATALVRTAVRRLNSGDIAGYLAAFAPTCTRVISGFDAPLSMADTEEALTSLLTAFDDAVLEELTLFGAEHHVCARWRFRGTHAREYLGVAPTGLSVEIETCEIYALDRGLVARTWLYGDPMQLFQQLTEPSRRPHE